MTNISVQNGRKKLEERIERAIQESGVKLPEGPHENYIQGWWFEDEKIREANKKGNLLTLDLDIGNYCDLACSFCFSNTQSPDHDSYVTKTTERIKNIIDEAVELGLKTIKIVGAGEPFLFKNLINIIEYAQEKGVQSVVFTGGHVIGDDNYARKVYGHEGITSGADLARRLKDAGASVIVKYLTFDDKLHTRMVNPKREGYDYTRMRDKGLMNLITAGLNAEEESRLGVDCLMMRENYKEAVELFSFFIKYNIFGVFNTSMDCGNTQMDLKNPSVLSKDEALGVATALYKYCIEHDIPFDKRISPYFCSRVCSQLNHGMFVGDNGEVKACPGGPKIGTYQKGNLREIWENNPVRVKYNCVVGHECISRCGKTYHADFEQKVKKQLECGSSE